MYRMLLIREILNYFLLLNLAIKNEMKPNKMKLGQTFKYDFCFWVFQVCVQRFEISNRLFAKEHSEGN